MARTDNLTNYLTDIANAIRTKGGTVGTINASQFDTAIANLPSGSGVEMESGTLTVTTTKQYEYVGFTNTHTRSPDIVLLLNSSGELPDYNNYEIHQWYYIDVYSITGHIQVRTEGVPIYATLNWFYQRTNTTTGSTSAITIHPSTETGGGEDRNYSDYYVTKDGFNANRTGASTKPNLKANIPYKWVAIWV